MFATLFHLAALHLLMAMLPGPNTVTVSYYAATHSRRAGVIAAAGVTAASFLWLALSLFGIGTLMLQAGAAYRLLRLLGALYLIYVAITMIRKRKTGAGAPHGRASPFRAGFLTTLTNPKSAVFWTSVFAVVLPENAPPVFYAGVLGWITVQAFLWYAALALTLSTAPARRFHARAGLWLSRVTGSLMLLFGLNILDDIRRS